MRLLLLLIERIYVRKSFKRQYAFDEWKMRLLDNTSKTMGMPSKLFLMGTVVFVASALVGTILALFGLPWVCNIGLWPIFLMLASAPLLKFQKTFRERMRTYINEP